MGDLIFFDEVALWYSVRPQRRLCSLCTCTLLMLQQGMSDVPDNTRSQSFHKESLPLVACYRPTYILCVVGRLCSRRETVAGALGTRPTGRLGETRP